MAATLVFLLTFGAAGLGAVVALALDAFGLRRAALAAAVAGTGLAAAAGVFAALRGVPAALVGSLQVGGPASMVVGVIALTGAVAIAGGWDDLLERPSGGSIAGLIAFGVLAAAATSAAIDLTTLLLAIETSALCAYALVAAARTTRSAEASMKYFVQGAVATGLFMFGLAVILGVLDPTGRYDSLPQAFTAPSPIFPALAGVGLVLCALTFKMGGAPFHSWAPDAYETAPAESAAFMASGQKLGAIAAASLFISLTSAGSMSPRVMVIVLLLAALSVLIGSLAALRQTNYRRLLGYAGVAQAGYALLAVALFEPPLAVFFGATYAIAATGTFLAASAFKRLRPAWDGSVAGLAGVGRQAPLLSGSLAVLLISLAGLPPFLGFWSKLLVFGTGISVAAGNFASLPKLSIAVSAAVALSLLGSVISLGYYGSILRTLFMDVPDRGPAGIGTDGGSCDAASGDSTPVVDEMSVLQRHGSASVAVISLAVLVAAAGLATVVLGSTSLFSLFVTR